MKARCRNCNYLNYDFFSDSYERVEPGEDFCGLHGRAKVNPDGEQQNLNSRGSCGYSRKARPVQLELTFKY